MSKDKKPEVGKASIQFNGFDLSKEYKSLDELMEAHKGIDTDIILPPIESEVVESFRSSSVTINLSECRTPSSYTGILRKRGDGWVIEDIEPQFDEDTD